MTVSVIHSCETDQPKTAELIKQRHILSTILLVGWVIPLPVAAWTVGEAGRSRLTSFTHPALALAVG